LTSILDATSDFESPCVGELLDDQDQPGPLRKDRVADQWLVVLDDVSDVSEEPALRISVQHDICEVVSRRDGQEVLDLEPLVGTIEEPTGARRRRFEEAQRRDPGRVPRGLDDLLKGDALIVQALGVDLDLKLPLPHAPNRYVGDAGHTHERRSDLPSSEHRHLDGGEPR
jgi:hypothetical protein